MTIFEIYSFQKKNFNSLFYVSKKATFTEQTLINTAEPD